MKNKYIAAAVTAAVLLMAALMLVPSTVAYNGIDSSIATTTVPQLTHAQETWMSALEWCESRGLPSAINPKDRDGTPSYGSFQFKPSTLIYFAGLYGIATTSTMDADVQRAVVKAMVLDGKNIDWAQQFPDCVLHKVGRPPLK